MNASEHLKITVMDQKRRILIVDDEPDTTRLLRVILERKRPYEVRVENDSKKALDVTRAFQPDVILLDIVMPDLDGGDVARLIREEPSLAHVPIIFISACAQPIAGYPFLSKPATVEKVIESIEENLLQSQRPAA